MRIICLVGSIGAGKTTFGNFLVEETNGRLLSTSKLLEGDTRLERQAHGDRLDAETDGAWVRDAIIPVLKAAGDRVTIIVDSVRRKNQIKHIRERWGKDVVVIGIKTRHLEEHLQTRELTAPALREIAVALEHPVEKALPMDEADMIIDNTRETTVNTYQRIRR
jgi:adenylate kinase family enzyme